MGDGVCGFTKMIVLGTAYGNVQQADHLVLCQHRSRKAFLRRGFDLVPDAHSWFRISAQISQEAVTTGAQTVANLFSAVIFSISSGIL